MRKFNDFEAAELRGFPTKPKNYQDMRIADSKRRLPMAKRKNVTYDDLEDILRAVQAGLEDHVEPDLAPAHRQAMRSRMALAFTDAFAKLRGMKG